MAKKGGKKVYVVTVDMGYGHQRAAYPLKDIATRPRSIKKHNGSDVICANTYPGVPNSDKRRWEGGRGLYETISRMKKLPIIGRIVFGTMDYLQRIKPFYPKRDLSRPTAQLRQVYGAIKKGWGKDLIEKLNKEPLPYITTFFTTAFFAEEHGYTGDIYCLCTDSDVSRAWAPLNPKTSRIHYFAPNKRVKERLMRYGVQEKNIYVTGFPLPKENIGTRGTLRILKKSLGCRVGKLDPRGVYQKKYSHTLQEYLGKQYCNIKEKRPLTIMFAVGGAGAQRDIGITILKSLKDCIERGSVSLILVAGSRPDVFDYYTKVLRNLRLNARQKKNISILFHRSKFRYFELFNEKLCHTDILWTKPSELSFYSGLGVPIIMAPTVGSQEEYNRAWLHAVGSGFEQEDPRYTDEWLFDWLDSGWLAQAAVEGFMDAPRNGVYHIEDVVLRNKKSEIEDVHLL
ncbi:MAG: hypothetical protein CL685_03035 [Candidatus Magasanikbacteria bacterium]|nr:hypothetical protein [Candidatus Magasanikbacteria bacterium]|tara:strand:+ start:9307 stop:10674 length:1368 start_codon:yes stop_codon:yes gene_type:complete